MCEFVRQPFKCDFFFTYVAFYLLYLINNTKLINWLKLSVVETDHLSSSISEKKFSSFYVGCTRPNAYSTKIDINYFFSKLFTFVYKEMYLYRLFQVRSTKWTRSWIRKCFAHFNWISFDVFDMHVPNHKTYVTHLAWIYMSWWN